MGNRRNWLQRARRHYEKAIQEPGDCAGDDKLLIGIALASAQIGVGAGWIPEVQKLGVQIAELSPFFDNYGNFLVTLPKECVADCFHQGECHDDVVHWQNKLGFSVPREKAIDWLRSTGGWDGGELRAMKDEELAQKVLWLACADMKEQGDWYGLVN